MPNKTLVQVPVAAKHVKRLTIEPSTIVGEVVTWKCTYEYDPLDDQGASIRVVTRVRLLPLGPAVQTTIQDFVTGRVVLDANSAEGT